MQPVRGKVDLNPGVHPGDPLSFLRSQSHWDKAEKFQEDYLKTSRKMSQKQEMD